MNPLQYKLDKWFTKQGNTTYHVQQTNNRNIASTSNLIQSVLQLDQLTTNQRLVIRSSTAQSKFDTWGHTFGTKIDNSTRIVLRNISSLPKEHIHNKNDLFINDIRQSYADIYCATEINVAWQNLPSESKMYERFKGKFEFAKFTSSNNKDPSFKGTYQPGGTITMSNGNICGRAQESGTETHTLQRWSWQKFRGANQTQLVVVTVYRPVQSHGPLSTYQQHKAVLLDLNNDECPRKDIMIQLRKQILQWQQENFQIIVAGDFNEDINSDYIRQFFSQLNMKELIFSQHGSEAPCTMIKGSKPIDGIFGSSHLSPIRSGYQSFDWGLASDHRLLWVDLDTTQLLGTTSIPLWKPATRRLKCNDPRTVQAFIKIRKQIFAQKDGPQLLNRLKDPTTYSSYYEWYTDLEKLDTIRMDSIRTADKKCRRLKMGNIPWSPTIQVCMTNISYLQRCRLKYINGYNINSRTLAKSFSSTNYSTPFTNPDDIIDQLKKEFTTYNKLKRTASTLRYNFLEELADAQAVTTNSTKEKIYKRLLLHESVRSTFRKIKFATKTQRNGVTIIEAPNEQGIWETVSNKQEIEQRCMIENITRSTQAVDTPTMLRDQMQLLGWKANTPTAQRILNGTLVDTTGIHPGIQELIPFMQRPTKIDQNGAIRHDITIDEYRWMWRRTREYTSCGISGLHFGHFVASSTDLELCKWDKWMMEISLNTGCSLKRWYNGIDVMIPKKANSYRVDKLRTIVLMEPDFNFLNKVIGKRVMQAAESALSIAPEQFGSRKRKSAIIHAVNKQLTTDILRQDKKNFCLIILDAKDCYGRITPMMTAFAMKRQGASSAMINLMLDTIAEMKHFIRTSFGDSENYYQQEITPFHGILQGNGAGPTIWAMISSILLDKLRAKGIGVYITTQDGSKILIPAFAFVDDTDLLQEIGEEINISKPQEAVKEWNSSLQTTGGQIVGDKCVFQVIKHRWENDNWTIDTNLSDDIKITIPDASGEPTEIRQSPPTAGEVALGIAFSPTGDMSDEITYLRTKTSQWAEKIQRATLSHYEAWTALRTTIFKTVEYALPSTTFSKQEMNRIISPALNIGLSKSGICRKTARKIIFATQKYQGFGIKDPFVTQGIYKLQLLFNTNNKLTLQLIDESFRRTVTEGGIGPDIFNHQYNTYKSILTKGWITNLWEFISDSNIELSNTHIDNRFRIRQDSYLIQKVFETHKWTPKQQTDFNNCRLYLQVETLSDIITANGLQVRRSMLQGTKDSSSEQFCATNLTYRNPSKRAWNNWKTMLKKAYNIDDTGHIRPPTDPISIHLTWKWFLQPSTDRIFCIENKTQTIYTVSRHSGKTRNKTYQRYRQEPLSHSILIPITVFTTGNGIKIDGIGTTHSTFQYTPKQDWCTTTRFHITGDEQVLRRYMTQETIILMSDASVGDAGGYAAWIISTPNAYGLGHYISGQGKIFEDSTDSHRAESFGILGAIHSIQQYRTDTKITARPLLIVCDNNSALHYACDTNRYPSITSAMPDFDVLTAIRYKLRTETVEYEHVKGHQDNSIRPWTILTTLNIHVDQLASETAETWDTSNHTTSYDFLPGETWQLYIGEQKIFKNIDSSIRNHITEHTMAPIWHKYKRIKQEWFQEVDWKAMDKAMQQSSTMQRLWILKRCARDCGSHAILQRRKEREDDFCPFCGKSETVEHVYMCQHQSVCDTWQTALQELEAYLNEIHTDPNIIGQLLDGIDNWRNSKAQAPTPMGMDQENIGWSGILEGVLGMHWAEEQQLYRTEDSLATSGQKWARLVIRKLWKIAWDIWANRNNEAHKNDHSIQMAALLETVHKEIETGHQGYSELTRFFSERNIEQVLQGNMQNIQCWLRSVQAQRSRLIRKQEEAPDIQRMRQTLQQFLLTSKKNLNLLCA